MSIVVALEALCDLQMRCLSFHSVASVIDVEAVLDAAVCSVWVICENDKRMMCGGPFTVFPTERGDFCYR